MVNLTIQEKLRGQMDSYANKALFGIRKKPEKTSIPIISGH
jgi:hypothetical protein